MKRTLLTVLALAAMVAALVVAATASQAGAPQALSATLNGSAYGDNLMEIGYVYKGRHIVGDKTTTGVLVFGGSASYKEAGTLVVYLKDVTCNAIYYSDGTGTADHATVSATGDRVWIRDAGGGCDTKRTAYTPADGTGDNVDVVVSPSTALKR